MGMANVTTKFSIFKSKQTKTENRKDVWRLVVRSTHWRFCFYFFSSKQRKLSFSENLLGDSGENIEIIAIAKYLWHPPTFQDKMADIDLLRCLEHETSKLYKFETQMDTKQIQNDLLVAKNRLLEGKSRIGKSRKLYYSRDDLQKDLEQKFQR